MSRVALCVLGFGLIMSGCMTQKVTTGPLGGLAADQFPAPDAAPARARQDHRIVPGDTVSVSVFRVGELSRSGQVNSAGAFFLPQVGDVVIAGKTSEEAAAAFAAALSPRYVLNPQVTVDVKTTDTRVFTVEGAVNGPGTYEVPEDLTLMKAMAIAKGTSTTQTKQVVVFRVIGGQRWANVYNLADIRTAKAVDPKIYADDMISVPPDNRFETIRSIVGFVPYFSFMR